MLLPVYKYALFVHILNNCHNSRINNILILHFFGYVFVKYNCFQDINSEKYLKLIFLVKKKKIFNCIILFLMPNKKLFPLFSKMLA